MATTANDIFLDVRTLLDEYTDDGTLLPDAEVADLQAKSIRLIDKAQKALYKQGNNFKEFVHTSKQVRNLLGDGGEWDVVAYEGIAQYYPDETGVAGATAYYFEVDGEATVTIEENQSGVWTTIATVSVPSTVTELTAYKGLLTSVSTSNNFRMKFAGTYQYYHKNRALFNAPYSASRIPDYAPYYAVDMPTDFRSISQIVKEDCTGRYVNQGAYKWQGFRDLYVSYYFDGTIKIIYRPIPTTITAITDTLEIDDLTATAIPFYVAAKLAPFENAGLVSYFEQLYEEALNNAKGDQKMPEQSIEDIYGGL